MNKWHLFRLRNQYMLNFEKVNHCLQDTNTHCLSGRHVTEPTNYPLVCTENILVWPDASKAPIKARPYQAMSSSYKTYPSSSMTCLTYSSLHNGHDNNPRIQL